jgi:hypothetical protein
MQADFDFAALADMGSTADYLSPDPMRQCLHHYAVFSFLFAIFTGNRVTSAEKC